MEVAQEIRRLSARGGGLPPGTGPDGPKRRILEAALGLFAEHGFAGASIRDIATAAGVRSATLYAHYNAKEQILADVVLIGHEDHHDQLRAASGGGDSAAQLVALVGAHVRWHATNPRLATVANAELHALSPELAAASLALRDASTALLVGVVERGTAAGEFAPADVWMAAAAIGGMGIRVASWFTPTGDYSVEDVATAYSNFALCIARGINA
ncbi:MAG TPA: TetR/AcrR family transcriptional regulator [Acidimicrobiales bacterium]|nr:TetR/AcrR family transcriptional regulator [Acidimicrobiales bacterium]